MTWPLLSARQRYTAAKAMQYGTSQHKKRRGRPQLTWLKQVENQLNELGIRMVDVPNLANDKIF